MKTNGLWVSVHLFYTHHNHILKNGIYPFILDLRKKNEIKRYFFIRYFEKGPHIRLRLLINPDKKEKIKLSINNYFQSFFRKYPSTRNFEGKNYFPNNTIQYIKYSPEIKRYGGKLAIKIAEKHFEDSSDIVLKLMQNYKKWDISIAQGKAIQLYTIFFKAINLSQETIYYMLIKMNHSKLFRNRAKIIAQTGNLDRLFTCLFEKNKNNIVNNLINIHNIMKNGYIKEFFWISDFYNSIQKTEKNLIDIGYSKQFKNIINKVEIQKASIYLSYLHMLNNRLGLSNHDEAYLNFIIYKLFFEIKI